MQKGIVIFLDREDLSKPGKKKPFDDLNASDLNREAFDEIKKADAVIFVDEDLSTILLKCRMGLTGTVYNTKNNP